MKIKKELAISDSGFLFNPTTGDSFSLNPLGVELFKLLQSGNSDNDIIKKISDEYRADKTTIEKDLYDFKQMLTNYKLSS
jgi:hypothetical protein